MTTSQPTSDRLDAILRKVQGLLANADDAGNTPEAQETYRQAAEALMFKYRIDEVQAASAAVGTMTSGGQAPVWRTFWICRLGNDFASTYRYMASQAIGHFDGKSVGTQKQNPDDENRWWYAIDAVGYDSDLRFADVLYTSMHLAFAGKMEPKVNPEKSDAENAYILRSAGLEGKRIALALWGKDDKPLRVKARKLFAQYAESIGEDASVLLGRGNSVALFRESYADGFESEMASRLYRMRTSHGDGAELVLASRKEAVQEALYERFPRMRPGKPAAPGHAIGGRDTCEKCKKASSGYCREHQWLKPRAARYVTRSYNEAGYSRGRVAARSVDLGSRAGNRVQGGSQRSIG